MKFTKALILIITLLFTIVGYAQFSRTHYIPPLTGSIQAGQEAQQQFIYISTPTVTDVNVRIIPIGGTPVEMTVSNNTPIEFLIGRGNDSQLIIPPTDTGRLHNDKGYIIEAEDLVYVSVRLFSSAQLFHAGSLVSKGLSGLGTTFRVGAFTNENPAGDFGYLSFVSIMATENNTQVNISDLTPGVIILNNTPQDVVLNTGESYVLALAADTVAANRDGLIGALVTSDKPVAVNSGSFTGSNGEGTGRDLGIDQLVSFERTGNEYIFVRGNGEDDEENPLIVAHEDDTEVFINGGTLLATLNAGEYISIDGSNYEANNNLYVTTSRNVFAFQGIGGIRPNPNDPADNPEANQGMFFVPPLNCQTPRVVDNIPFINNIGNETFTGGITIVTEAGADVTINGTDILALGAVRETVTGNPNFETYLLEGLTGNVTVASTSEVYVAFFGASGFAAFGGYYSGFAFEPEVALNNLDNSLVGQCIPNVELGSSSLSSFDTFQWFLDDEPIPGANDSTFIPQEPGFYYVVGEIIDCPGSLRSEAIPVSLCPSDADMDGVNDNIDIDIDNDGIINCLESFGDQNINLTNPLAGTIPVGNYAFTGAVTTQGNADATPIEGIANGNFRSSVPLASESSQTSVTYQLNFNREISLILEYGTPSNLGDGLLTNDEEFIIQVPVDKTMTLLNPDNQLLVDTNFDGIFEAGVTEFSSFQLRFRLNEESLALGEGTFSISSFLVDAISYTHVNNSQTETNQATFRIFANCVARDTDNDGVEDAVDLDSDNDSIPDFIEASGETIVLSGVDDDLNGLDDVFDINAVQIDSDLDTVLDYLDLDSDNDGIFDLEESGSLLPDTNLNGIVDNPIIDFGENGWIDIAETAPDSRLIGYVLANTDADEFFNYLDSDSDADLCDDVIEAGFSDANGDTLLGNVAVVTNNLGLVTNAVDGYTLPNENYIIAAVISIVEQPENQNVCELSNTIITITPADADTIIQWQLSTDGEVWTDLVNNAIYSEVNTNALTITAAPLNINTTRYRARLDREGNSCGLFSEDNILTVHPLPIINSPVELLQCDDDTDGFSAFNLTEVNAEISDNSENETFTYYVTETEAIVGDENAPGFIANPTAHINRVTSSDVVWARIVSEFGCAIVSEIQIRVSVTAIPPTFQNVFFACDDFLDINGTDNADNDDRDGVATFNFSRVTPLVEALFPAGQNPIINYYRNEADALAEANPITDTANYRNIGFPGSQDIFIRVDSEINNDCLGFGIHVTLNVEALPVANPVTIERQCDDDNDGLFPFDVSQLETNLLNGQNPDEVGITYFDEAGNALPSPLPNPFLTSNQTISIVLTNRVTNAPEGPCTDQTTLEFIVDELPIANLVNIAPVCDGDDGENDSDGLHRFDTSQIENTILNGQTGLDVFYFDGVGNALPSPLPNPFVSATQTISVEVVNPINRNCIATTSFDLIVNPLPIFSVETPLILCQSDPNFTVVLDPIEDNPLQPLNYNWTDAAGNFLSNGSTLTVTVAGVYFITITNADGTNCSVTQEIEVISSEIATITPADIAIVDNSDNNTITINTNNLGLGDYEFALDDEFLYQDEPFFENVEPGIHTIFVRDKNGCGTVSIDVSVIGFPKFLTPNNDGFNDTWQILGVSAQFQSETIIYIFDRYGKLLNELSPLDERGWNGTFNGQLLPTSDYWFRVQLEDGRLITDHFTLKR